MVFGPVLSVPGSNVKKPHGINREAFSFRCALSRRERGDTLEDESKMQSKISTTQLDLFNESALPEAVTLHADRPGFFSLLVKPAASTPRQTSYRVDVLPQVLAALDPDIDSYMSQATFFRPNRRLVNLWHLPLCFVDLDTYKTAYGKLHQEPLSLAVRQRLADVGVPPASLVIHSGRGVYLKWLLKSPLPQAALPRWNAVQRELVSRLADFGSDPKARDASRVLRLVSTCNTKQPDPELRKVRVLWVEEADGEPLLHDFERLAEAVLPFTRKEAAAIEADKPSGRVIQFKRGGESALELRRFSFETLHWDRVTDMRKLRQLRGPIAEGGRETFVFLMLNELAQSGQVNTHNFQYETVALARECDSFVDGSDWSRSTFSTLYRRVKEHVAGQYGRGQGLYKYQNQTLIEQLEITPDEERHMKTLISTTEKYRRKNERRNEARGYQSKRVDRAKKIVELHRAGLSLRQISVVVGCGLATVSGNCGSRWLSLLDQWVNREVMEWLQDGKTVFWRRMEGGCLWMKSHRGLRRWKVLNWMPRWLTCWRSHLKNSDT